MDAISFAAVSVFSAHISKIGCYIYNLKHWLTASCYQRFILSKRDLFRIFSNRNSLLRALDNFKCIASLGRINPFSSELEQETFSVVNTDVTRKLVRLILAALSITALV